MTIGEGHLQEFLFLRQMGLDGVIHLLGHVQCQVAIPREILPCRKDGRHKEDLEEALLGAVGRHSFVFLQHEIRRARKDEIVLPLELLEIHGLGGLEQKSGGGRGLEGSDHLAIGRGKSGVGVYADVGNVKRHGGKGTSAPSRTNIQDPLRLEIRIDPLRNNRAELVNGPIVQLEHIVLRLQEMGRIVGRKGLLFVADDEFGKMGFCGGILHRFVKGDVATGLSSEAMMKKEIVQRREARASEKVFFRRGNGLQFLIGFPGIRKRMVSELMGTGNGHGFLMGEEGFFGNLEGGGGRGAL